MTLASLISGIERNHRVLGDSVVGALARERIRLFEDLQPVSREALLGFVARPNLVKAVGTQLAASEALRRSLPTFLSIASETVTSSSLRGLRAAAFQLPGLECTLLRRSQQRARVGRAFQAAWEDDREYLAGFIADGLRGNPTPARVDAVQEALLEGRWREVAGDETLECVLRRSRYRMKGHRPLWERQCTGQRILLLGETLDRIPTVGRDPIEEWIDAHAARELIDRMSWRLSPDERPVFYEMAHEGELSQAARNVGQPAERAHYIKKKIRRWVDLGLFNSSD